MKAPAPAESRSGGWSGLFLLCVLLIGLLCTSIPHSAPSSDSFEYFKMATGGISEAASPYRYRDLVPLFARGIPGPVAQRFEAITLAALTGVLLLFCRMARREKVAIHHVAVALAIVCCCPAFNFMLVNPWLTDAAGLFFITLMAQSLMAGDRLNFSVAGFLGLLTRETVVFLFPALLILGGLLPWIAATIGAAIFLVPRLIFHPAGTAYLSHTGWAHGGVGWAR